MRRALVLLAVLAGVAMTGTGVALAVRGYLSTSGPDGVVGGYFAALQRGDAAQALGFGEVPRGDHSLLTAPVLAEQQRIAALDEFAVTRTRRNGDRADVDVRYMLEFDGAPQLIHATVPVRRVHGDWLLVHSAVPVDLDMTQAAQRASILGTAIPSGTVLIFPGALPIRFDTSYLQLDPRQDHVQFGDDPTADVAVQPSAVGRRAAESAAAENLLACLRGHGPITCPLPTERYVPGSVRGRLLDSTPKLTVTVQDSGVGLLQVTGRVGVEGTYRRLDFDDVTRSGKGRFTVQVRAAGYAVPPLRLYWTSPA